MLKKGFFLLALVAVLSGCGSLKVFSVPVIGFSNDPAITAAKAEKIRAEAGKIKSEAEGYKAVADGVAQSVTPENAHLIPISPDDPRSITTGKVEANGNANISIRQGGGDPPPRTYDYGQPGNFGNGHWHVGR